MTDDAEIMLYTTEINKSSTGCAQYIPQLMPVTNRPNISSSGDDANWHTTHSTAPIYAGMQLIRTAFFLKLNINTNTQPPNLTRTTNE